MDEITSQQITNDLIEKVKNLQKFKIVRVLPKDFSFNGVVPFDLEIDSKGLMTFTVYAMDLKEANQQVNDYLS